MSSFNTRRNNRRGFKYCPKCKDVLQRTVCGNIVDWVHTNRKSCI